MYQSRRYINAVVVQVLKKEFPKGMDLIYESVGGEMFEQCVKSLAVHGRIVVIGAMSQCECCWGFFDYGCVAAALYHQA